MKLFQPEWVIAINVMGSWDFVRMGTYEEFTLDSIDYVRYQTSGESHYVIIADSSIVGWRYILPTPETEESTDGSSSEILSYTESTD